MANPKSILKSSSILIVGGGVFGLSTALHLAQDGYTNITVLDRAAIPSPYSAGNDLNKIVRAEYEDPFYTELALEAIAKWQTSFWSPYYRHTGYLISTSSKAPQKASDSLQKSFSSIKNHTKFPAGSFSVFNSDNDARDYVPMLQGEMKGWKGYFNRHAGYAKAGLALQHVADVCEGLGVKFITGDNGYVTRIIYKEQAHGRKNCCGVKTVDGVYHEAESTICCLGAHTGNLLPEMIPQLTAKSWAVAHIQLNPDEVSAMIGCPVVNCRDLGFFFEPDEKSGLIKLCANGAGYTNYVSTSKGQQQASLPTSSNGGIPKADEDLIKRLIQEAIPQFSEKELVNKFICWCADTSDSEYIIDFVPSCEGLIVATGDSGHTFKMLPLVGKWVVRVLEKGDQSIERWKWKANGGNDNDISWRVGEIRDIKDVERFN